MQDLQIFTNPEFGEVRAVEHQGINYAVANDVAAALGYARPRQAVMDHCKGGIKLVLPSAGGEQETTVIPEGDIYRLIIKAADQSRNPDMKSKAERFERWLYDEVLPSIRKTGGYIATKADDSDEEIMARAYLIAQETLKRRDEKIHQLEATTVYQGQIISELTPKASYYDIVLQSSQLQPITLISKDYGLSGQYMNKLLAELGVQYRLHETWVLYQEYASRGYTQSKTHVVNDDKTVMHTYWTQKGRLFIYELLKTKKGILPMIERYETA